MEQDSFFQVFPRRLKYYMERDGINQADLAKRLKVAPSTVNSWCQGEKAPRMDKVDKMCDIFDCNRSDLMNETPYDDHTYILKSLTKDRPMTEALARYFAMDPELKKTIVDVINHMGG